jgi:hypothetical protein
MMVMISQNHFEDWSEEHQEVRGKEEKIGSDPKERQKRQHLAKITKLLNKPTFSYFLLHFLSLFFVYISFFFLYFFILFIFYNYFVHKFPNAPAFDKLFSKDNQIPIIDYIHLTRFNFDKIRRELKSNPFIQHIIFKKVLKIFDNIIIVAFNFQKFLSMFRTMVIKN